MTAKLYIRPDCPYCEAARRSLEATGEPFETVDVTASPIAADEVMALTGGDLVVPVLVEAAGEVRIGYGGV